MQSLNDIKRLLTERYRQLQKLKEKEAKFGLHTPSYILVEIEDIETEIENLQLRLAEIKVNETSNELGDTISTPPSDVEAMKYYLYVSEFKVEMFWSQISGLVNEDDFNTIHDTQRLYAKLRSVIKYIDRNIEVGTIDNPKSYFRGALPMSWGVLGTNPLMGLDKYIEDVVYFGGYTQKTIIGLGGSARHLTSIQDSQSRVMSHSAAAALLVKLSVELKQKGVIDEFDEPTPLHLVAATTKWICRQKPTEYVEFLAKKLDSGGDNQAVLFGTPIYVAMAE